MFEEVPCERRGLSRWVPVRRVVIGPFVLGGGMLLAALGGSVAVAAAATVLTASAISSDVPPRPEAAVAPATSHPAVPVPVPRPTQHRPGRPVTGTATAGRAAPLPGGSGHRVAVPAATGTAAAGSRAGSLPAGSPPASSQPVPTTSAVSSATPSSSGPRGNAVIHLSGYDPATGRFAYQFATALPQPGRYLISGPQTFTAVLAPSATITSAGSLCPPAGSSCTPDELIAAAGSGLFAEVAIDVDGALRSVVELGVQAGTAKRPLPSTTTMPAGDHPGRHATGSPQPAPSPTTSS